MWRAPVINHFAANSRVILVKRNVKISQHWAKRPKEQWMHLLNTVYDGLQECNELEINRETSSFTSVALFMPIIVTDDY